MEISGRVAAEKWKANWDVEGFLIKDETAPWLVVKAKTGIKIPAAPNNKHLSKINLTEHNDSVVIAPPAAAAIVYQR